MRREHEFLQRLLRGYFGTEDLRTHTNRDPDWSAIEQICLLHGLFPALAEPLLATSPPKAIADSVRATQARLKRRAALLQLELERLYPSLLEACPRTVVVKGVAVAQRFYPRSSDRFFVDLDVLVPTEDVRRASETLRTFGYEPPEGFEPPSDVLRNDAPGTGGRSGNGGNGRDRMTPADAAFTDFRVRLTSGFDARVELHWDLTAFEEPIRFDVPDMLSHAETLPLGMVEVRVPSAADLLLYTATKALRGGFSELRRVLDAAMMLRSDQLDWTDFVERARRFGAATATWLLLTITEAVVGVAAPTDVVEGIRPEPDVEKAIRSLEPVHKLFSMHAHEHPDYGHLLRWLCGPGAQADWSGIASFVDRPHATPSGVRVADGLRIGPRTKLGKGFAMLKVRAYLGWRRVVHGLRRG